ncbi:uncharacterized protein LOC144824554 [Lissotriton helveticus]
MGIHISYPLVNQPVVFEDESEEDESECTDVAKEIHEINVKYCKNIIRKREASKAARELYEEFENQRDAKYEEVLQRFPDWTADVISKLQLQFMVTDSDDDYLVGFSEYSSCLDDMEVEATVEERKAYFTHVDIDKSGIIDFQGFLQLMYNMKQDGWSIEMTYSKLLLKMQSVRISGSEKARIIGKMDTFQQMCYKVF